GPGPGRHAVGPHPGAVHVLRGRLGDDENVPRLNFGGLDPFHLDDVISEDGLDRVGDDTGLAAEYHFVDRAFERAAPLPAELAPLDRPSGVLRQAPARRGEIAVLPARP